MVSAIFLVHPRCPPPTRFTCRTEPHTDFRGVRQQAGDRRQATKWKLGVRKRREDSPTPSDIISLSLSSGMTSSSLDMADRKSSSESIPRETVVTGVGGAASAEDDEVAAKEAAAVVEVAAGGVLESTAEAAIFFLRGPESEGTEDDSFASAAFRFLVVGGIVPAFRGGWEVESTRA